jgi:hypothetical protein
MFRGSEGKRKTDKRIMMRGEEHYRESLAQKCTNRKEEIKASVSEPT